MRTNTVSKRILSVTIKRIADYDADSSHLGEFSDTPNDYAIVHRGEYAGQFVRDLPCECGHSETQHSGADGKCIVTDTAYPCDCDEFDRVTIERGREYRYFNPPIDNYQGESDDDLRKYSMQDYERMRTLGETWNFVGIAARAEVQLNGDLTQTITSGGLWEIESDNSDSDFAEVEDEQLDELRDQLHAIGFSKRAIAAAFRSVERSEE